MNVQAFMWKNTVRYYNQLYIFICKVQSGKKEKIPLRSRKGNIVKSCVCDLKILVFILKTFRKLIRSLGRKIDLQRRKSLCNGRMN